MTENWEAGRVTVLPSRRAELMEEKREPGLCLPGFVCCYSRARVCLALLGWVRAQGGRIWEDKLGCIWAGGDLLGFPLQNSTIHIQCV